VESLCGTLEIVVSLVEALTDTQLQIKMFFMIKKSQIEVLAASNTCCQYYLTFHEKR